MNFFAPLERRLEHHWLVAGTGHGKTTAIKALFAEDLKLVQEGKASVIVIDSQEDLIKELSHLRYFYEHPEKLCLIDASDVEFPLALNFFDVGLDRIDQYSIVERERLLNVTQELFDFILGALLSAELTTKQGNIFGYVTRLMLVIPGANIHTFRALLTPKGFAEHRKYVAKLDPISRDFFDNEYNEPEYKKTRQEVNWRVRAVLRNNVFQRMFSHKKNKLDLFKELNEAKVILVNTSKRFLREEGSCIFGRFFIALVMMAVQERANPALKGARLPTFLYIDEAHEYLDKNVANLLRQARKLGLGMILAHQEFSLVSPALRDVLAANTNIKFAGGASFHDAAFLAKEMRTRPEFISDAPQGYFAAFIKGITPNAISLHTEPKPFDSLEQSSEEEFGELQGKMRDRYAVPLKEVEAALEKISPPRAEQDEEDAAKPSSDWSPVV